MYNQSTGALEALVFHMVTEMSLTNFKADGHSYDAEVNSNNEWQLTLDAVSDENLPKLPALTPIVHTFKLTSAELATIGINSETRIIVTVRSNGDGTIHVCRKECWFNWLLGKEVCGNWKCMDMDDTCM